MGPDCVRFTIFSGDTGRLPVDRNYLIFRWTGSGEILFSVTQKGKAAFVHFTSDKAGLRHIKQAFNEFCDFVFWLFEWCTMIMAHVERKPSIGRVLLKCEFEEITGNENAKVYARYR